MAILAFQKPDKVIMLEADDKYGKFEFRPLEPGYGITVGNALRRILLSSLEGFAITTVKIEGIDHEFSTITGVMEDVTEIILNLKQVRFKRTVEDVDHEKITIKDTAVRKSLKQATLIMLSAALKYLILNWLSSEWKPMLNFRSNLPSTREEVMFPLRKMNLSMQQFGLIAIDSIFTPIRNVKYAVENYRVEQKTDYEKLLLEIETDGSIHPKDALKEAAKILIYHFMLFSDEKITLDSDDKMANEEFDEEVLHMRQLLKTKLVDLDLSVRALNCLKAAEVETLGDLVNSIRTTFLNSETSERNHLPSSMNCLNP